MNFSQFPSFVILPLFLTHFQPPAATYKEGVLPLSTTAFPMRFPAYEASSSSRIKPCPRVSQPGDQPWRFPHAPPSRGPSSQWWMFRGEDRSGDSREKPANLMWPISKESTISPALSAILIRSWVHPACTPGMTLVDSLPSYNKKRGPKA